MKKAIPALLLFALVAAGCIGNTISNVFFGYEVERLDTPPATAIPFATSTDLPATVVLTGGTSTLCFTDELVLDGTRGDAVLTIRVLRSPRPGTCTDTTRRHFRYMAQFSGLRTGAYTLRVINETTGTAVTEFEQTVNVRG